MTPKEYIDGQSAAFVTTCEDMGLKLEWDYKITDIEKLDLAQRTLWPNEPPDELGNAVSIMWAAQFSRIIEENYISRWEVDRESNLPLLVIKCGKSGIQLKTIILGAQTFNKGDSTFVALWEDVEKTLIGAGAEKS